MAENVVINIEANTSGLTETINLLTKLGVVEKSVAEEFQKTNAANVASIQKGVQSTTKEFEKLDKAVKNVKADNGLAKALDQSAPIAKTANSVQSLKAQLKEATNEAQQLLIEFGELDPRTKAAANRASELRQNIDDTNRVIKALDPGEKFRTIQTLGTAIGGAFQVATGALQAFGVENKKAQEIAQQFQGALNIFGGLQQLAELKDSLIAVKAALGITQVQAAATGGALEAESVAAEKAAVSNKAFGLSLSATGLGAVLLVISAIALAFYQASQSADKQADATKRIADETNRLADAQKKLKDAKNEELSADLKLQVVRGEITQADAERRQLQITSTKEYTENTKAVIAADLQQKRAKKELEDAEKALAAAQAFTGQGSAEARKAAEERVKTAKKEVDITTKLYNTAVELRTAVDNTYRKEFTANKELEVKAFTDGEKKKQDAADKTNEKTKPARDTSPPPVTIKVKGAEQLVTATNAAEDLGNELASLNQVSVKPQGFDEWYKKLQELKEANRDLIQDTTFNIFGDQLIGVFDTTIEKINEEKDAQLEAISEEENALKESYDKRLIGKRNFELQQEALEKKRADAALAAEKKLAAERRKADIAKRAIALFEIFLNTRRAITAVNADPTIPTVLKPGFVAQLIIQGGVQAAAVLAQPLPKYKKGTLSVGGVGSDDSQLALLQPGEAVIPTDTNRKYHPAIKAIYQNKIRPEDINAFVKMRLRGDVGKDAGSPVTAKMDIADIYALGRIIKKNDGVTIKNVKELASIFADNNNPRR